MTDTAPAPSSAASARDRVAGRIIDALAQVLKQDPASLTAGTRLFDDLGLDSTTVLELLMRLEEELEVEFDTEGLEQHHFETVDTLTDFAVAQLES
ncbi:phosphopantetheine-binding protein [Streptomonospora litoralis]|uniref:Acyl carrier protein n=1 Tax=Streptomonospora litoralis TaxID=2498135 RepID=A0A4P6PX14_9ACTN|nr:phosphopantetheine-binding protein [Streptomonospora litoralis]QBI52623.1 acyl carrier protein [Streptomonospora litoralis]